MREVVEEVIEVNSIGGENKANKNERMNKGCRNFLITIVLVAVIGILFWGINRETDKKYISAVKEGSFDFAPDIVIGEIFDKYFDKVEWRHFGEGINHQVTFRGECLIDGVETYASFWFKVAVDAGSFEFDGGFVGKEPKWPGFEIEDVIDSVYTGKAITRENYGYTVEEYINSCVVVDTETIGRNESAYIGKDVLIEGTITETFGVYAIGLWSTAYPITVEYEGPAYDTSLNPIGKILSGDHGLVAGEYVGDNTIEAQIVIITE